MRLRVQMWGNSLAMRIPQPFAREVGLEPGAEVDLALEEGCLVVTPMPEPTYSLGELLEGVTDENRHDAVESGPPEGREVW